MKAVDNNIKKTFTSLKNACNITQIGCFIYAFLSMVYWFCKLAQAEFIKGAAFLFEPVYGIVKLFYVQKTMDIAKGDLSGVIASVIFIIFGILAKVVKDEITKREEIFYINLEKKRKEEDLKAQKQIEREYYAEMSKYNKFIVLVDINLNQIQSYLFDNDVDEDDLRGIKLQIIAELFRLMDDKYIIQKAKCGNDSFYVIGFLGETANCLRKITNEIRNLSEKYNEMNVTISYDLSFDAVSDKLNIEEKLKFLKKVLQLNYNNSTLTTSLFKTCYEITGKSQMLFTVLGKFQFFIDGKATNYELYSVRVPK